MRTSISPTRPCTPYSYSTSFDGEGAITSAIDYVTNPDQPVVYTLTGHGEEDLPATFADSLEKENITVEDLSLLNTAEIPEDVACLIVYAPQSDISEAEGTRWRPMWPAAAACW